MEEIELTPEQIDGINKLAFFLRECYRMAESPNTRRRPRCPSCDDGIHRNWKQIEQDLENPARKQDEQEEDKDELPEK